MPEQQRSVMPFATVQVSRTVYLQQVTDALTTFFEAPSEWAKVVGKSISPALQPTSPWYSDPAVWESGKTCVSFVDAEDDAELPDVHHLTKETLGLGLKRMAYNYPKHFQDLASDNHDAITADVLVQCALFGDIIYG